MHAGWSRGSLGTASPDFADFHSGFGPAAARGGGINRAVSRAIDYLAPCPWSASIGSRTPLLAPPPPRAAPPLYTAEQRRRRDASRWTLVQGILAPLQFAIFLISLGLVLHYLATGTGYQAATLSVIAKTAALYTIMVTGAIWEKRVFGQYLFAPAFFWEDAMSMLVIALHTLYLAALAHGATPPNTLMGIALAAYASYAINATQFLLKLRAARLQSPAATVAA